MITGERRTHASRPTLPAPNDRPFRRTGDFNIVASNKIRKAEDRQQI